MRPHMSPEEVERLLSDVRLALGLELKDLIPAPRFTDLEEYHAVKPPKKPVDPKKVPPTPNSFMLFRSDFNFRKLVPAGVVQVDLSRITGAVWSKLSSADSRPWVVLADKLRKRRNELYPDARHQAPQPRRRTTGDEQTKHYRFVYVLDSRQTSTADMQTSLSAVAQVHDAGAPSSELRGQPPATQEDVSLKSASSSTGGGVPPRYYDRPSWPRRMSFADVRKPSTLRAAPVVGSRVDLSKGEVEGDRAMATIPQDGDQAYSSAPELEWAVCQV